MSINYVDWGYFDGRYMRLNSTTYDLTTMNAYFEDLYDRLVAVGKMDDTDVWSVSKVGRWTSSGTRYAYGIRIEHRVSGTPSGSIWLITMSGQFSSSGTSSLTEPEEVMEDSTHADKYYSYVNSTGSGANNDGFIALHYYDEYPSAGAVGGTDDYDWGVTTHFDIPTTSPDADMDSFMPDDALKGQISPNLQGKRWVVQLVFDADGPAGPWIGMEIQDATNLGIRYRMYAGELTDNADPIGDTSTAATFGSYVIAAYNFQHAKVQARDGAGTPDEFDLVIPTTITILNEFKLSGDLSGDVCTIDSGSYIKGALHRDIFPLAYATGDIGGIATIPGGIAYKAHDNMLFPWPTNVALPGFGWPANSQVIPT